MPTIALPIQWTIRLREPSGPIRRFHHARTTVFLEAADGHLADQTAIIDTGASYTQMSATLARSLNIPFPPETSVLNQTTAAGGRAVRVHEGELRVRFPPLPDRTFRLYCLFVEELPPSAPVLIGLHDTLELFRLTFDGRPAAAAPVGQITLETV